MSVTDRPIIFSAPMVRAILDGRKTQTRRLVKHPEYYGCPTGDCPHSTRSACNEAMNSASVLDDCPFGPVGARLWVRETWRPWWDEDPPKGTGLWCVVQYRADNAIYKPGSSKITPDIPDENHGHAFAAECDKAPNIKWRPSIHMSRWASRITLEVTSIRCEQLHGISDADAEREGFDNREAFRALWSEIYGEQCWLANPWVWVVGFERVTEEA